MKQLFRLLPSLGACILLLASTSAHAEFGSSGVVYYVCNNHVGSVAYEGDDANDGLSPDTAWRTFEKALQNVNDLQAGDTLAFCRGGRFYHHIPDNSGNYTISNLNSTAADPLVITSYVPNAADDSCTQAPIIYDNSPRFSGDPLLPRTSSGPFRLEESSDSGVHNEGLIIEELAIVSDHDALQAVLDEYGEDVKDFIPKNGIYLAHDYDHVTLRKLEISGFNTGISIIDPGQTGDTSYDGDMSHITISQVFVHDNLNQGFIGDANDLHISDSVFINNGYNPEGNHPLLHNIYLSKGVGRGGRAYDQSTATQNISVRNSFMYRSSVDDHDDDPATPSICGGTSVTLHGAVNGFVFENNVVMEDRDAADISCYGLSFGGGYSYKHFDAAYNARVLNNTIINVGRVAIGCFFCDGAEITGNTIVAQLTPDVLDNPYAPTAISIPVDEETDYDPCYEVDDAYQLSVVSNSVQNGLATDPGNIISDFNTLGTGIIPTRNDISDKADGQWRTATDELMQWLDDSGNPMDKPFESRNPAYESLNCNPKHVVMSDNSTRAASISGNRFVFDVYPDDLNSKSEAIQVGDNVYNYPEIDLNDDGVVDDADSVDVYSVHDNVAYYSSRTLIESDTARCAADVHTSSLGVDVIDDSAGATNQCLVYDAEDPLDSNTLAAGNIVTEAEALAASFPQTSEEFWVWTGVSERSDSSVCPVVETDNSSGGNADSGASGAGASGVLFGGVVLLGVYFRRKYAYTQQV